MNMDEFKQKYTLETRKCSECRQFKDIPPIPVCEKKLMCVTRNMHVCYEIEKGSCFEPKEV